MKKQACLIMLLSLVVFVCSCQTQGNPISESGISGKGMSSELQSLSETFSYQSAEGKYDYQIENGAVSITRFTGDCAQVSIPEFINGMPVKSIEEDAFYQQTAIQSLVLPKTLESIGHSAFYRCNALKEIYIPQNVEKIGSNPFFRCTSLQRIVVDTKNTNFTSIDGILYSKDSSILYVYPEGKPDTRFTIPDGVLQIDDTAFGYLPQNLQILVIPVSVAIMPNQVLFPYPSDELTLWVTAGSVAEQYARDWKMQYVIN